MGMCGKCEKYAKGVPCNCSDIETMIQRITDERLELEAQLESLQRR